MNHHKYTFDTYSPSEWVGLRFAARIQTSPRPGSGSLWGSRHSSREGWNFWDPNHEKIRGIWEKKHVQFRSHILPFWLVCLGQRCFFRTSKWDAPVPENCLKDYGKASNFMVDHHIMSIFPDSNGHLKGAHLVPIDISKRHQW